MKQYPEMKDSGVAWIGMIPFWWECKKVGSLFSERRDKVSDKDYPPLSVARMGIVSQLETAVKTDAGDNRKLVCAGDFVINSRSDRKGSCGVSDRNGSVSLINIVLTPKNDWNSKYVHYLLRSHLFSEEYYRYGRGIVADLWTTRFSEMKNILLPVPSLPEQNQIVRFLDWKVSEINRLINLRKKQIAALEELKKSVISRAVTKGLDPSAKMKDSGVAWIGEIPDYWEVQKLKRIVSLSPEKTSTQKSPYIGLENIDSWYGTYNLSTQITPESICSVFHSGDILFGKLRPYLAKCVLIDFDGVCSGEILVLTNIKCNKTFLKYFLMNKYFIETVSSSTYGAKMPRANWNFIGNQEVTLPPLPEQDRIVAYLDEKTSKIDAAIDTKKQQSELLQELKTRLISDVVTGKIDVRGVEIPEYEVTEEEPDAGIDEEKEEEYKEQGD